MLEAAVNFRQTRSSAILAQTSLIELNLDADDSDHPDKVREAFKSMVKCLEETLGQGGGKFPIDQARGILPSWMGWSNGRTLFEQHRPATIKFSIKSNTWFVLPELMPLDVPGRGTILVDQLGPIYRTASVGQPEVRRVRDSELTSLAVIHQDDDPIFGDLGSRLWPALRGAYAINTFGGRDFRSNRLNTLRKVFHEHRAVLVLCHYRPPDGNESGGWELGHGQWLSMREVATQLGLREDGKLRHRMPNPIPELLFNAGCQGAVAEEAGEGRPALFYPRMFLNAGVRFFVGAFMDVVLRAGECERGRRQEEDKDRFVKFIAHFLCGWAHSPDQAPAHLFKARSEIDFHPVGSLFQLYVSPKDKSATSAVSAAMAPEKAGPPAPMGMMKIAAPAPVSSTMLPTPAPRAPEPVAASRWEEEAPAPAIGGRLSRITPGSKMGNYALERELWGDPHSRTFWAHRVDNPLSVHMVQVLADEYQDETELDVELLESVIADLNAKGGRPSQLIPQRHERIEEGPVSIHVLVYDRPGEHADSWLTLRAVRESLEKPESPQAGPSGLYMEVLNLGTQIANALASLHASQQAHGNFDLGSIVFCRSRSACTAFVKDAWLRRVVPGRLTRDDYAPPEAPRMSEGSDELKADCWGLGMVLFFLATGTLPFDEEHPKEQGLRRTIGERLDEIGVAHEAQDVPPALERVVRDCLMPEAWLRPSAQRVSDRLVLATVAKGDLVPEFMNAINVEILAGRRLFTICVDDLGELESSLASLCRLGVSRVSAASGARETIRYRLFVAEEGIGIVEKTPGAKMIEGRWMDRGEVTALRNQAAEEMGAARPPRPTPDDVGHLNAAVLLDDLMKFCSERGGNERVILLVKRYGWWEYGATVYRQFREFQSLPENAPVVIVADRIPRVDPDRFERFHVTEYPPLTVAAIFDQILAVDRGVEAGLALRLAFELFPCSSRDLSRWLGVCLTRYGKVDTRALLLREDERSREFSQYITSKYVPYHRLGEWEHFGMPASVRREVGEWSTQVRQGQAEGRASHAPRRLMVRAPGGCGKTTMAHHLAARLQRPLLRVSAASCLRSNLGDSESSLRNALELAMRIQRCVVLLDDVDRFFDDPGPQGHRTSFAGTMQRMSGAVLNWLDQPMPDLVVVLTASDPRKLDAAWRRRMDWILDLPLPSGYGDGDRGADEMGYRASVFDAAIRRCGVDHGLAADELGKLASVTEPRLLAGVATVRVPSPVARAASGELSKQRCALVTSADISCWVEETLRFHGDGAMAETAAFWLGAAGVAGA